MSKIKVVAPIDKDTGASNVATALGAVKEAGAEIVEAAAEYAHELTGYDVVDIEVTKVVFHCRPKSQPVPEGRYNDNAVRALLCALRQQQLGMSN